MSCCRWRSTAPIPMRCRTASTLSPGDYVAVPLGPAHDARLRLAIAGRPRGRPGASPGGARVSTFRRCPRHHRAFIDWVAHYYMEPKGNVLRLALRAPGVFAPPREQVAYRLHRYRARETDRAAPPRARYRARRTRTPGRRACRGGRRRRLGGQGARQGGRARNEGPAAASPLRDSRSRRRPFGPVAGTGGNRAGVARLDRRTRRRRHASRRRHRLGQDRSLFRGDGGGAGRRPAGAAAAAGDRARPNTFIARVERRFGAAPAAWHSGMRPRERERVWLRCRDRRGAHRGRRALGAVPALGAAGLIVVDEEHEAAYKQEDGVPYHARDMAVVYGALGEIPGHSVIGDALARKPRQCRARALRPCRARSPPWPARTAAHRRHRHAQGADRARRLAVRSARRRGGARRLPRASRRCCSSIAAAMRR